MAEELRFFLRTAVYSIVIAAIYWFASYAETGAYEWAGTVLLAFVVFSAGAFVFVTGIHVPSAWRSTVRGGVGGTLYRAFGMAEDPDTVARHPLDGGPELFPSASPWPIIGGAAALLIGLGLVYGPWLLLPGIALAIGTVIGWIAQESRRT
ncbi:MAG: cytochrome c oxidase subunit 4 [Chloroflexota bacterium]